MPYNDDLLEIPEFLRRQRKRGRPRKIKLEEATSKHNKWEEWDEVKAGRYGIRYDIMLQDEAPNIGSGFRTVYVKEGRKWAHMTCHSGDPEKTEDRVRKKFTLKKWFALKAAHEKYLVRNGTVKEKANETNA